MKIESEEYQGLTIEIHYDPDPESPRNWDNLGTMVCWHRRHHLGDEQPKEGAEEYFRRLLFGEAAAKVEYLENCTAGKTYTSKQWDKVNHAIDRAIGKVIGDDLNNQLVMLPLYLYDHSGIAMRTGAFGCPWDSGQVGLIYCTLADAVKEYASVNAKTWNDIVPFADSTLTLKQAVITILQQEVKTYDEFITGQVYGFEVKDENGDHLNSCWGFYGLDYCLQEARDSADRLAKSSFDPCI